MIFFYISLSTYICFNIIKYKQTLFNLQKNKYDIKKYWSWIFTNYRQTFLNKELLSIILIIIAVNFNLKIVGSCTVIFYTLMFLLDFKMKNKLKINKQMVLRMIAITLIYLGVNIWFVLDYISYHYADIIFDNTAFYYIILILMSYFAYIITAIANIIIRPFDKLLKNRR